MAGDSAGGKEVGRISIRIVPDLKDFRAKLAAELKAIEDSLRGTVTVDVDVDSDGAKAHLRTLLAELKAMAAKDVKVKVDVDGNAFRREADAIATGAAGAAGGLGGMGRGLAIVAAVVAFAAPALALLSGVLVSLPAVIAGVLVPVAAIALGLDGIKKAAEVMKPGLDSLKAAMSDRFKDVLTPVFQKLNDDLFPALKQTMPGVASALGLVAKSFTDVITSGPGLDSLKGIIQNIRDTISQSAPGIGKLTSGLLGLANGVTSKFPAVGKWLDSVGDSFDKWVAKVNTVDASGTSPLDRAMGNLGDTLKGVLDIIGDLAKAGFDFLQDPEFGKSMTTFIRDVQLFIKDTLPLFKSGFEEVAGYVHDIVDTIDRINSFKVPDWIKGGNANDNKPNPSAKGIFPGFNQDLFDNGATNPVEDTTKSWNLMTAKLNDITNAWLQTTGATIATWATTTWGQLTATIQGYWTTIANAGTTIWNGIASAASAAWAGVTGIVSGAVNSVIGFFGQIPAAASSIWSGITGVASSIWAGVVSIFVNAMTQLVVTVTTQGAQVINFFAGLPGQIVGAMGSLGGLLVSAGEAAMDGLLSGIKAGVQKVYDFVSGIAAKIAALKGPISYDKTVLTPNGQALMQGLQDGIEGGLEGVLQRASAIAGQINDAMNNGGTVQVDGLKDQLKRAMDELALESKDLKVQFDAIPKGDKDARKANQDQRATVQSMRDQLALQADQLGFSQKYGDNVEKASTDWGEIGKKLTNVGTDFAKATTGQFMSDIGMSGQGALTGGAQAGLDWLMQLGTTNIHVNSIDEGLAAKQNLTNKRAMQYTQR